MGKWSITVLLIVLETSVRDFALIQGPAFMKHPANAFWMNKGRAQCISAFVWKLSFITRIKMFLKFLLHHQRMLSKSCSICITGWRESHKPTDHWNRASAYLWTITEPNMIRQTGSSKAEPVVLAVRMMSTTFITFQIIIYSPKGRIEFQKRSWGAIKKWQAVAGEMA